MNGSRSLRNLRSGLFQQALLLALGLLLPRLVLVSLGSEANGLLNSARQVFACLSLLESGVSAAALRALYGPTGRGDRERVGAILSAAGEQYRRAGLLYLAASLLIAAVYPPAVPSALGRPTVRAVLLLTAAGGALTFFVHGKYALLLRAEGRNYVQTNLASAAQLLLSLGRILLLLRGFGVVAVQGLYLLIQLIQAVYLVRYVRRRAPDLAKRAAPDHTALRQKNYVLLHQLSALVFNNTDTLILTAALGLKAVSVYALYALLFGTVHTLIETVTGSVHHLLGQAYSNDRAKFSALFDGYEAVSFALSFALYAVAASFALPFLRLYTAGITDADYLIPALPWLFAAVHLLSAAREPAVLAVKLAGHYNETAAHSGLEAAINLTLSLLFVGKWGICGVLAGTVAALLFRSVDLICYTNRRLLHRGVGKTLRRLGRNGALFLLVTASASLLHREYGGWLPLVGMAALFTLGTAALFLAVNAAAEGEVRIWAVRLLKSRVSPRKSP